MRKVFIILFIMFSAFIKAESVLDSIIQVYHKQKDDSLKIAYGIYIIAVYNDNGHYNEAEKWLKDVRFISDKTSKPFFESRLTYFDGLIHYNKGNFREAADEYSKSLNYFRQLNDTLGIVNALNNMGLALSSLGNYTHAFQMHIEQMKISRKAKMYSFEESGAINIILIYLKKGQNKLVIKEAKKYINEWNVRNPPNTGILYQNMGVAYSGMNLYDSSLWAYQNAEKIFHEAGMEDRVSEILNNIGNIYLERKDFKEAEKMFQRSLVIKQKFSNRYQSVLTLLNLCIAKMELGDAKFAFEKVDSVRQFAFESGNIELQKEALRYKILFYARLNKLDSLESWATKYNDIISEMYNAENNKQLLEMEQKYQSSLKEEQIKNLEKEKEFNKTRNKFFLLGAVLLALIIIILSYSVIAIRRNNKKLAEQKKKVDEAYTLLEDKNKEILDSIYYARRIQKALITNEHYIIKVLKNLRKS